MVTGSSYGFRAGTSPGMTASVIIPRHADFACDVVIARGKLHAGARGLLTDGRAIELLPRRLVGRVGKTAPGFQFGVASFDLLVRNQDVGASHFEVDAHLVAGLEDREPAVGCGFRRSVQDRGRARGAGLPSVTDAGQRENAAFDQGGWWLHVH